MSEDLEIRFERQVAISLQYANDEKSARDKMLLSVFELQVGHLRDIGKEMATALSALSAVHSANAAIALLIACFKARALAQGE